MDSDKRKVPRRKFQHRALIVGPDKSSMQTCSIADISEAGAQLTLATADTLPGEFTLIIAKGGAVKRQCTVIWQSEKNVGVQFHPTKAAAET
jgi:PilZ domain